MAKLLVVNADDFGFTHDVNEGIVEAHRRGVLTSTTLMANGAAFGHAAKLALANPSLDVGCHLVLVGGVSVSPPHALLPATVTEMLAAVVRGRLRIYEELAAQVERIRKSGIRPTHLDTHKHTHLFHPVLEAVARISSDFGIPWVRRPFDLPLGALSTKVPRSKRAVTLGLGILREPFRRVLVRHGCRCTDHFAGFQITGRFGRDALARLIEQLPAGITEFMCHPGYCREELSAASTRLKESRERELAALTAPETFAALEAGGVRLVSFRDL